MILIHSSPRNGAGIFQSFMPVFVPVGIGCLLAVCRKDGIRVELIDEQIERKPLERIKSLVPGLKPPYVFGFSVLTGAFYGAVKLAGELKLSRGEVITEGSRSIENDRVYGALLAEVNALINKEQGFKPFEKITKIFPVLNDFSVGKELTQTLKVKRKYVEERFTQLVDKYFKGGEKK